MSKPIPPPATMSRLSTPLRPNTDQKTPPQQSNAPSSEGGSGVKGNTNNNNNDGSFGDTNDDIHTGLPPPPSQLMSPLHTAAAAGTTGSLAGAVQPPLAPGMKLYDTHALCPRCIFTEGKQPQWKKAVVESLDGKVYFTANCDTHGKTRTLYCSDEAFFLRAMSYDTSVLEEGPPMARGSEDIEDLIPRMQFAAPRRQSGGGLKGLFKKSCGTTQQLPLIGTVALYENGAWVEDDVVFEKVIAFRQLFENDAKKGEPSNAFFLKLTAMLSPNTRTLNRKIQVLLERLPKDCVVVVESSHDRLMALLDHPDSAFYDTRVYPALKIWVVSGKEETAAEELRQFCKGVRRLTSMSTMITLCIAHQPVPNLATLLTVIRRQPDIVRGVMINVERPAAVQWQLRPANEEASLDIYHVLRKIEKDVNGFLRVEDFIPVSACALLEPFLALLGHGRLNVRPSPMCGFLAIFVNTEQYTSASLARLLDLPRLYQSMLPIVRKINSGGQINLTLAKQVKDIVLKHLHPDVKVPSSFIELSMQNGRPSATVSTDNLYRTQFIVVHNTMDLACLESRRRAACVMCTCNFNPTAPRSQQEDAEGVSSSKAGASVGSTAGSSAGSGGGSEDSYVSAGTSPGVGSPPHSNFRSPKTVTSGGQPSTPTLKDWGRQRAAQSFATATALGCDRHTVVQFAAECTNSLF